MRRNSQDLSFPQGWAFINNSSVIFFARLQSKSVREFGFIANSCCRVHDTVAVDVTSFAVGVFGNSVFYW